MSALTLAAIFAAVFVAGWIGINVGVLLFLLWRTKQ